jgi:heparan-alpha-glucosaminide N-acetyltransferase
VSKPPLAAVHRGRAADCDYRTARSIAGCSPDPHVWIAGGKIAEVSRALDLERTAVGTEAPPKRSSQPRYLALDAFRGFIMLVLVSGGFGLAALAKQRPEFTGIANQFDHMPWEWISFWDLIQPAFMFMVGVAMPFAIARRVEQGTTRSRLFWHVVARALRLILASEMLISIGAGRMQFQLINVLAQVGITYFLCYLIMQLKPRWQVAIAGALLVGHWALFVAFPGTEGPFMSKTTNVGAEIDKFVFGHPNDDDWTTINFLTSTVTTLFGAWTGQLLRSDRSHGERMLILAIAAVLCLALGWLIHPWNPVIKRICTTSFTLYSAGWVLLMLLGFYWLIEVWGYRRWAFPLVVIGANSIFIYSIHQVLQRWLDRAVGVFTLRFAFLGDFGAVAQSCTVLVAMWGLCYWLYQRRIFFKL